MFLSEFLAKGNFRRVQRQSRPSEEKVGNEMKPEAMHRSPGIYLTAEVNPGKPQQGGQFISMRMHL